MPEHAIAPMGLSPAAEQASSRETLLRSWLARRPLLSSLNQLMEHAALRRALAYHAGGSVLATAGAGAARAILQRSFESVVELEMSRRHAGIGSDGLTIPLSELPCADNSFDWAVCDGAFVHASDIRSRVQVLRALRRVAAWGVVFSAHMKAPLRFGRLPGPGVLGYTELREEIAAAGLQFESIHYVAWPVLPKAFVVCTRR